ncbi:MAG: sigma-70 family RNA polymerase sigma factor [Verrucomicrobiota bacterium]
MNTTPTPAQSLDRALVHRLQAHEPAALEELVAIHGSRLYAVALQIMRNETDAQEVVQDALITIWQKIGSFENRSAFTTWLHRVTANAALMKLRKNKRFTQTVSLDETDADDVRRLQLPAPGHSPGETLLHGELGHRVQAAIDALPEPYRTTVVLADVDELSMEEVSEATGVSMPAVKSRLHRGRLALRQALAKYLRS